MKQTIGYVEDDRGWADAHAEDGVMMPARSQSAYYFERARQNCAVVALANYLRIGFVDAMSVMVQGADAFYDTKELITSDKAQRTGCWVHGYRHAGLVRVKPRDLGRIKLEEVEARFGEALVVIATSQGPHAGVVRDGAYIDFWPAHRTPTGRTRKVKQVWVTPGRETLGAEDAKPLPLPRKRGARFTWQLARRAAELKASGLTLNQVAERVGAASPGAVWNWIRRHEEQEAAVADYARKREAFKQRQRERMQQRQSAV